MLPPETIATIGPFPAFPVNAAASGKRAGAFRNDSRLLRHQPHRVPRLLQAHHDAPSTTGFIRSHMRGNTL